MTFFFIKNFKGKLRLLFYKGFQGKIIPMGRSLGSASVCHIIDHRINHINGCIIESGFATEYSLIKLMGMSPDDINFSLEYA